MQLWNETRQVELASEVRLAKNFFSRLKGLLGTTSLPQGQALLIQPCSSVHTLGMRYAIDVVFMAETGQVRKIAAQVPPGRAVAGWGSAYVLELPAGTVDRTQTAVGDLLLCRKALP